MYFFQKVVIVYYDDDNVCEFWKVTAALIVFKHLTLKLSIETYINKTAFLR